MNRDMYRGLGSLPQGYSNGGGVPRNTVIANQPHMLAYINPQEEQMLRDSGGSGIPGPGGIPAYANVTIVDAYGVSHSLDRKEAKDFQDQVDRDKALIAASQTGDFSALANAGASGAEINELKNQAGQITSRIDIGETAYFDNERRQDNQETARNEAAIARGDFIPTPTVYNKDGLVTPEIELGPSVAEVLAEPATELGPSVAEVLAEPSVAELGPSEFTDTEGYLNFTDMIDGGGPGYSGATFGSGGGTAADQNNDGYIDETEAKDLDQNFISTTSNFVNTGGVLGNLIKGFSGEPTAGQPGFVAPEGFKDLTAGSGHESEDPDPITVPPPNLITLPPPDQPQGPPVTVAPEPIPMPSEELMYTQEQFDANAGDPNLTYTQEQFDANAGNPNLAYTQEQFDANAGDPNLTYTQEQFDANAGNPNLAYTQEQFDANAGDPNLAYTQDQFDANAGNPDLAYTQEQFDANAGDPNLAYTQDQFDANAGDPNLLYTQEDYDIQTGEYNDLLDDYGTLSGQRAGLGQAYNLLPNAFDGNLGNYNMYGGQQSPVTNSMFNQSYVEGATALPNNVGNFQQASADPINAAGTSNVQLSSSYLNPNTGTGAPTFEELLAMYQNPYA